MDSFWFEQATDGIRPDDLSTITSRTWDVVVIGGGIVGLLAALRLREHGRDVCLIEARAIGEGTTAHSTVKVTSGHGGVSASIAARQGMAAAVAYQRANDEGFLALSLLVESLGEDVGWSVQDHIVYASEEATIERLKTSAHLATQAGTSILRCMAPEWSSGEAWAWRDSALVQPLSLARAIARAVQAAGVPIVERVRVRGVHDGGTAPRIMVEGGGEVRARDVIVATHSPIHDPDLFTMRTEHYRHAAIAVPVPDEGVPTSYAIEGLSTRPIAYPDGTPGAVVVGQSRRVGSMEPRDWLELEAWAMRTLRSRAATHRWGAQDPRSLDYLPFVGRTAREQHVLVVTGLNAWGFTNAAAIADRLADVLDGQVPEHDDVTAVPWQARRANPVAASRSAPAYAWWIARSSVRDMAASAAGSTDLAPGEGRVVGGPFRPRAECVTPDGVHHRVSGRCTHMGCLVRWNAQEISWDCPCHGSRFRPDGEVIEGPADRRLDPA